MEQVHKAKNKKERLQILTDNADNRLGQYLMLVFGNINWAYTTDSGKRPVPKYTTDDECPYGYSMSFIHHEYRRANLFTDARQDLGVEKQDQILMNILEALHPYEAKLFAAMVSGQKIVKGLTEALVREAFPTLLPEKKDETTINV